LRIRHRVGSRPQHQLGGERLGPEQNIVADAVCVRKRRTDLKQTVVASIVGGGGKDPKGRLGNVCHFDFASSELNHAGKYVSKRCASRSAAVVYFLAIFQYVLGAAQASESYIGDVWPMPRKFFGAIPPADFCTIRASDAVDDLPPAHGRNKRAMSWGLGCAQGRSLCDAEDSSSPRFEYGV
jgi:hypothetical protein